MFLREGRSARSYACYFLKALLNRVPTANDHNRWPILRKTLRTKCTMPMTNFSRWTLTSSYTSRKWSNLSAADNMFVSWKIWRLVGCGWRLGYTRGTSAYELLNDRYACVILLVPLFKPMLSATHMYYVTSWSAS